MEKSVIKPAKGNPKSDLFLEFFERNGFKENPGDNLRWDTEGSYGWKYSIYFEGYAYVLYMHYRDKEVPLTHFRNVYKLKTFWDILNEKFKEDDPNR